jgi:pSer/pThr/pTyr-binding forkhead associated (FHA) protein
MAEEVVLKIIGGNLKGEEFVFDEKGLCLIGRSSDCALQIPKEKDMKISRRHCLLILNPPNVRIRDLGSRNGTYVNDKMLQPGMISSIPEDVTTADKILKHGDKIEIGECILLIEIPSQQNVPESYIVSQVKPHAASGVAIQPKSNQVDEPRIPPSSSIRPTTVSKIPPPHVTNTTRSIAVTEVMSRDEIRGVANLSKNHVQSTNNNIPADQINAEVTPKIEQPNNDLINSNQPTSHPVSNTQQPRVPNSTPGTPAIKLTKKPVPVITQQNTVQPNVPVTPPVPVIKKPGRVTNAFSPLKRTDPGPLTPPPPSKTPTIVLSKKKNSESSSSNNAPRPILKAKIVNQPQSTEVEKPPVASQVTPPVPPKPELTPHESAIQKAPTDKIKTGVPHDKYQDTIVMDPTEMEGIPDLVSSTIPEMENSKRVAKFKIKGLK